jgi:hypothetical protein
MILELNALVQNIIEDPIIKEKLNQINTIKKDVIDRIGPKIDNHNLGAQITKTDSFLKIEIT